MISIMIQLKRKPWFTTFKPWSSPSSNTGILSLIHFFGDEDLQSRLRTLCTEFSDIFSNELPKEPANIPQS